MRLKRVVVWASAAVVLLVGAVLVAVVCAAVFLPWERYERSLHEILNRDLPVRVLFEKPAFSWGRHFGITLNEFRILSRHAADGEPEILVSRALVIRPSLSALLRRDVRLKLLLDSPRVELSALFGMEGKREDDAPPTPLPSTLSGIVALPAGFSLTGVDLRIRNGNLGGGLPGGPGGPGTSPGEVRELEGSFLLRDDLSFQCRIDSGLVERPLHGERPWSVSGSVTARVSGRFLPGPPDGKGTDEDPGPPIREEGAAPEAAFPLPPWLQLAETRVAVEQGTVRLPSSQDGKGPDLDLTLARASVRLDPGMSFRCDLEEGALRWKTHGVDALRVSGIFSGHLTGRLLPGRGEPGSGAGPFVGRGRNGPGATAAPAGHGLPLPRWLALTELDASVRDGHLVQTVAGMPQAPLSENAMEGMHASVRLESDGRFGVRVVGGVFHGRGGGETPWQVSARCSGTVNGRILSPASLQAEGTVRLEGSTLRLRDEDHAVPDPLDLSLSITEASQGRLAGPDLRIQGHGLDVRATAGEAEWKGPPLEFLLREVQLDASEIRPLLLAALPPGADLSGTLAVTAGRVSWRSGEAGAHAFPSTSFLLRIPGNLALEGASARLTEGRARLSAESGFRVELDGLRAEGKQEGGSRWTGRIEAASSEVSRVGRTQEHGGEKTTKESPGKGLSGPQRKEDPPGNVGGAHFAGAFTVQGQWTESADASHAVLVADLTAGHLLYGKVLDKPAGVRLQAGGRARFGPDEIRLGRLFVDLGDMRWQASGSLKNPGDPVLDVELASNTVSLDHVAGLSPAAAEHGARGRVEIQRFHLRGNTQALEKTATLQVRVAGKGLEYNRAAIEGFFAEAVYGNQILTLNPLIVVPEPGSRVEATFSGDFSAPSSTRDPHPYYGTVKMEKVALDKIITLARPDYSGRVSGIVDANAAGRATGESWETVRSSLEARARVYVQDFRIHGDGGRKLVDALAPGDAAGLDLANLNREQMRLLSGNHASARVLLKDEKLRVRNLVGTYEGKVVEMDGSLDFSGRLQVDRGTLFLKNRQVPFRLNCRIGEGKCLPSPDLKAMGKSAGLEIFQRLQFLSSGSRDVFKDLLF